MIKRFDQFFYGDLTVQCAALKSKILNLNNSSKTYTLSAQMRKVIEINERLAKLNFLYGEESVLSEMPKTFRSIKVAGGRNCDNRGESESTSEKLNRIATELLGKVNSEKVESLTGTSCCLGTLMNLFNSDWLFFNRRLKKLKAFVDSNKQDTCEETAQEKKVCTASTASSSRCTTPGSTCAELVTASLSRCTTPNSKESQFAYIGVSQDLEGISIDNSVQATVKNAVSGIVAGIHNMYYRFAAIFNEAKTGTTPVDELEMRFNAALKKFGQYIPETDAVFQADALSLFEKKQKEISKTVSEEEREQCELIGQKGIPPFFSETVLRKLFDHSKNQAQLSVAYETLRAQENVQNAELSNLELAETFIAAYEKSEDDFSGLGLPEQLNQNELCLQTLNNNSLLKEKYQAALRIREDLLGKKLPEKIKSSIALMRSYSSGKLSEEGAQKALVDNGNLKKDYLSILSEYQKLESNMREKVKELSTLTDVDASKIDKGFRDGDGRLFDSCLKDARAFIMDGNYNKALEILKGIPGSHIFETLNSNLSRLLKNEKDEYIPNIQENALAIKKVIEKLLALKDKKGKPRFTIDEAIEEISNKDGSLKDNFQEIPALLSVPPKRGCFR